jgi:polar amino acid transport system permease protein
MLLPLADLTDATLGAQVGTTSYQTIVDIVQPSDQPAVYNTNDDAKAALENGTIDGLVVDLPTAFFMTAAEIEDSLIVGQLPLRQPGCGRAAGGGQARRSGAAMAGAGGGRARAELTVPQAYRPSELQRQRLAYRRRQTVLSVVIASISTVVVGVLLYFVVTSAPGWERVKASFLDAAIARDAFPDVLRGLWLNVRLLVFCAFGALALGLGVALLRTLRPAVFFPLRALATSYTYVFRGAPLIIVLYLLTFGVPGLRLAGTPSVLVLGGIALVITYGAYLAEVFRAGIESIHPSQRAAARSLGLSYRQTMRHVVLPQAVRRVTPPMLNDLVALQKDVGLISLAGPIDAIRAAQINVAETFNYTPYVVAAALFVLMAIPLVAVTDWVTLRAARRQSAEGTA